jgi:hypothetical protein
MFMAAHGLKLRHAILQLIVRTLTGCPDPNITL